MFRFILAWAALWLALISLVARGNPLPKNQVPSPSLSGSCVWGKIEQTGRNVSISGGPSWSAVGRISREGVLHLAWTNLATSRTAFGSYHINTADISGVWGYFDEVDFGEDGEICAGDVHTETIQRQP